MSLNPNKEEGKSPDKTHFPQEKTQSGCLHLTVPAGSCADPSGWGLRVHCDPHPGLGSRGGVHGEVEWADTVGLKEKASYVQYLREMR